MKPAPFRYHRATSVADACAVLAADADAKVLAGGQSLVPLLSMRLAAPSTLVDINGVAGLDAIEITGESVRVGALVRHAELLAHAGVQERQPLLALALAHVAHPTIRNRGTSVGSLVHGDAAAELPAVLLLLGGSVDVVGVAGPRTIAAADLYIGPLETSLHHDEVAVAATFPTLPAGAGVAFEEIARRHGDYALVGAAALVTPTRTTVAFISASDAPTVVDLTGVADSDLGEAALAELDPAEDIHATADYRAHLVRVLTARVVAGARGTVAA